MGGMKKEKTIFIVADHDFSIRYLLYTNIFGRLKEIENLRIVVLTRSKTAHNYLKSNFKGENVVYESMNVEALRRYGQFSWNRWTSRVCAFVLNANYDINTALIQHRMNNIRLKSSNPDRLKVVSRKVLVDFPVFILRRSKTMRHLFRFIANLFPTQNAHGELYKRYKPHSLIITSLGHRTHKFLMKEAKRHGVEVLSIILNWDNTTTKGMRTGEPDHVIVWNEFMKEEVIGYHDVKPEKVYVGGVAHYDMYYRRKAFLSKDVVFEKWGLNPKRKVLFYGAMSPTMFKHNPKIVELLAKACADGRFAFPCQLIVRLHPIYYFRLRKEDEDGFSAEYDRFMAIKRKYNTVVYNFPQFVKSDSNPDVVLAPEDMTDLVNILNISSVLICFFSTLMLEGSILDVPVVSLCLDGMKFHYGHEKESVLKLTHLQDVLKSRGVRVAYSESSLIQAIDSYLIDPGRDREGRRKIRESKCGAFAGNAGINIANYVEQLVLGR